MEPKVAVILGIFKKENEDMLIDAVASLKKQSYKNFTIHAYDNTLNPTTPNKLKEKFPDVEIFKNSKNLGFTGGNNQVMREIIKDHSYKYLSLINDDVTVDKNWLKNLVAMAESDPQIAGVDSKMVFFEPFVRIKLNTTTFNPSALGIGIDTRDLGVQVYESSSFLNSNYIKRFFREGFWGAEYDNGKRFTWMKNEGIVDLPIGNKVPNEFYELNLVIGSPNEIDSQKLDIEIGKFKKKIDLRKGLNEYKIKIPIETIKDNSFKLIQNAGSNLRDNLDGHDVGSGEKDDGKFDKEEERDMICGCGNLMRTEVLRKVGLFDEWFLTYYEDSDLSMRIKKEGFRIVYQPKALINHYHSSSSGEYSPWFLYSVWKNKPIFVIKNFSWSKVFWIYGSLFKQQLWWMRQAYRQRFKDKITNDQLKIHTKSMFKALLYTPTAILKRYRILKDR